MESQTVRKSSRRGFLSLILGVLGVLLSPRFYQLVAQAAGTWDKQRTHGWGLDDLILPFMCFILGIGGFYMGVGSLKMEKGAIRIAADFGIIFGILSASYHLLFVLFALSYILGFWGF